jgi:hypothetical protein
MANYYGAARSNYFQVKDLNAFKASLHPFNVQIVEDPRGITLLSKSDSGWDWYNPKTDEPADEVDLISRHLQKNEVCVLMETGAEKLCFLGGYAVAFDHTGKEVSLNLNQIYDMARAAFGDKAKITEASY